MNAERQIASLQTQVNEDGETYHISEISDHQSSDDNVLDELSQMQESMGKQCISREKKEMWHSHLVIHLTGRTRTWTTLFH